MIQETFQIRKDAYGANYLVEVQILGVYDKNYFHWEKKINEYKGIQKNQAHIKTY